MLLDFILNGFLLSITNVFRFVVDVYCFFLLFGKVAFFIVAIGNEFSAIFDVHKNRCTIYNVRVI